MPTLTQVSPYKVQGTYHFYGEEFLIDEEDGEVIIHHPRWSLAGSGKSLGKAEHDLLSRSQILLEAYSDIPDTELSAEARNMLSFLHKIA